jgi:hypothetical protein
VIRDRHAVVLATGGRPTVLGGLLLGDHEPMAWAGADQLLYLASSGTTDPSGRELAVLDFSGERRRHHVPVAHLAGPGPWTAATPAGSC